MGYHIDTGLILDKFKENSECPLCAIEKVVEEGYLHEFLNDAVMEDNSRIKVKNLGFCDKHFSMLFNRPNKLSVALQMQTRAYAVKALFNPVSPLSAKKSAKKIEDSLSTCVLCDYIEESMIKYYKTIAELFLREKSFSDLLLKSKGFCMHHYAKLLEYSSYAGFLTKNYLSILSKVQQSNFERILTDLDTFCKKHDYRNANMPLGSAENSLEKISVKFYGKSPK